MTNQEFCYWLQGYFEISKNIAFTKEKIMIVMSELKKVHEPLDSFTQWLMDLILFFASMDYKQKILDYFQSDIQLRLNSIFYHVIDVSYENSSIGRKHAKKIHDGIS